MYNFGGIRSRNLRVYAVNSNTFCGDMAKIGISRQISQNKSWTYLDLLYRFARCIDRDDYPDIHLAVALGTVLWQPVKFGRCLQTLLRCSKTDWPIINRL